MKKVKLTIKPNKNVILTILLLAGIAWSIFNIFSAPPDPGHAWADLGDIPGDALPVARGGTGTTTLALNGVILGNTTGNVKFVYPGTNGNVLASNGTTWASSNLTGLVTLLYSDETSNTETFSSTSEINFKWWVMNINPALYNYYILEADIMGNMANGGNGVVTYNWNLNFASYNGRFLFRLGGGNAATTMNGVKYSTTISTTTVGVTLPAAANLKVSGNMTAANASLGITVHAFRVYGVK
jgi:hypothetical protein